MAQENLLKPHLNPFKLRRKLHRMPNGRSQTATLPPGLQSSAMNTPNKLSAYRYSSLGMDPTNPSDALDTRYTAIIYASPHLAKRKGCACQSSGRSPGGTIFRLKRLGYWMWMNLANCITRGGSVRSVIVVECFWAEGVF